MRKSFVSISAIETAVFSVFIAIAAAGCTDSTEPLSELPLTVRLEATTPTSMTGMVGTAASSLPTVLAKDQHGNPVRDIEISFVTDGEVVNRAVRTDDRGLATAGTWTLRTVPGRNTLVARYYGSEDVVFTAIGRVGPVARLTHASGNDQAAVVGATLPGWLSVKVGDSYGNPVSGATVNFAVVSGDGRIGGGSALSGYDGIAILGHWTLGASVGVQQVKAWTDGAEVTFTATARACYEPCRSHMPQLLFTRHGDIFSIDLATSDFVQLTFNRLNRDPAWSPDGKQIAFARYDASYRSDIYIMNADGSNLVRRTVNAGFHSPKWSPNGDMLAVASGDEYVGEIYLLSVRDNGANAVLVTEMGAQPAWSPDGKKIAFVSLSGDDGYHALHVMNSDGSGVSAVTLRDEGGINRPSWSPDGKRIVVSKCIRNVCDLYSVDPDGATPNAPAQVTQLTQLGDAWSPDWSPDGTRIAFMRGSSIAYVAASGGAATDIILSAGSPAWRP
ncbi:MAG: hypothetical protein ACR2L6_00580 [Gemmatimonadaceae bacterium]